MSTSGELGCGATRSARSAEGDEELVHQFGPETAFGELTPNGQHSCHSFLRIDASHFYSGGFQTFRWSDTLIPAAWALPSPGQLHYCFEPRWVSVLLPKHIPD